MIHAHAVMLRASTKDLSDAIDLQVVKERNDFGAAGIATGEAFAEAVCDPDRAGAVAIRAKLDLYTFAIQG